VPASNTARPFGRIDALPLTSKGAEIEPHTVCGLLSRPAMATAVAVGMKMNET
jgi:hypothetical protein